VIVLSIKTLKKDFTYIISLFVLGLVFFRIIFYKDSFVTTLKILLAIFIQIIIPGYFLVYVFFNKPSFAQKFILGIGLSTVFFTTIGYILGTMSLNIKFYWPLFIILTIPGIYYAYKLDLNV